MFWELGNTKRGLEFLEDPQQFNSYSYARNNPILYTDPSGEVVETFWDAANVVYDAGNFLGAGALYVKGVIQSNEFDKQVGKKGMDQAALDMGADSLSLAIPGLPAGTTKIGRAVTAEVGQNISKIDVKGFGKKLSRHFRDHGADFGAKTENQYKEMAIDFFQKDSDGMLQKVNQHGDSIVKYDSKTNTFGSIDIETGLIRTFFKPKDGKDYFDKQ